MDAEVKRRWVAALRSGEYQQGNGFLRTDSGYCCMGVLCDRYDPNLWQSQGQRYDFQGCAHYLPSYVKFWAGLASSDPDVTVPCGQCDSAQPFECECTDGLMNATLSTLNDEHRWPFNRIADVIEEQL